MGRRFCSVAGLLSCIFICLLLVVPPTIHAQSISFTTSTVDAAGKVTEFTTFSFPRFDRSLMQLPGNMTFSGNSTVTQNSLQITPDSNTASGPQNFLVNQTGRAFFSTPFVLWTSSSSLQNSTTDGGGRDGRHVASFSAVFKFNLYRLNVSHNAKGEGLAFVVASASSSDDDSSFPPPSGSYGGYLGLTNASTDGNASNGFVAVELDTVKQPYDPDDNHVGLDVNGVRSAHVAPLAPLGIQLAPSDTAVNDGFYTVWVEYNGTARHVSVYMGKNSSSKTAVLNASLDISKVLVGNKARFGFSASTGAKYQLNCVNMWNMTVEKLSLPDETRKATAAGWKLGVAVSVPCAVLLAAVTLGLCVRRKRTREKKDDIGKTIDLRNIPGMPKEFDYKELKKGTNNFDDKMKLGQGGYGVVYRATVVVGEHGETMELAVKQFSGAKTKGQEDFLAELGIINRLRHRNLVKLVGWCHQNGVLLLVYDLMPSGSLDRYIFGAASAGAGAVVLSWKQRYAIVVDVASALNYLHNEYDQTVIHRDIKPSNVMLDAAFNARLGDFGLARAVESDKTAYTDRAGVPGTLGYIAPECFHTGRATRESDVFGFGAVVLETVCGRRMVSGKPFGAGAELLEDVWELHGAERLLESVDPRLAGDVDQDDAERLLLLGLACSHPNPGERPTMHAVMQIVTRAAPPPEVTPYKPAFVWPLEPVLGLAAADQVETSTSGSGVISSTLYYQGR